MALKIAYIAIYFLITQLIPALGVSWDLSNPIFIFSQKLFFVLLAIILFKKDLWLSLKEVKVKQIITPLICTFLSMSLTYLFIDKISGTGIIFGKYYLSLILILESILIVPFIEEVVYRYCFINSQKRYYRIVQMLLSSTLFMYGHAAAAHYNVILLIPFFVLGILLSLTYMKKKNIWYSIFVHSSYNFFVIFVSVLTN